MVKYIIKTYSKATKDNPNFANEDFTAYYGKNQKLIGYVGSHAEHVKSVLELNNYNILNYGYNRECDAKRSWIYKNPERNSPYWTPDELEIIKVEVN